MNQVIDLFNLFPVFYIDSIVLREINPHKDHLDYYHYINSEKVAAYLSKKDLPSSEATAITELDYWYRLFHIQSSIYWAIADRGTNKIIGTCGFNYWNREHQRAEISYDLDANHWGKGIMTNSLEKIVSFGLNQMQLQRIQATVAIDNTRSIKILEKLNFDREGVMKKYCILNNATKDFYMYAIVN